MYIILVVFPHKIDHCITAMAAIIRSRLLIDISGIVLEINTIFSYSNIVSFEVQPLLEATKCHLSIKVKSSGNHC